MLADPGPAVRGSLAPGNLDSVLDELDLACLQAVRAHSQESPPGDTPRVSVADVMALVGPRSFGPLLLVPGLIGLSPIGAIPGLPGIMAIIVLFVSTQVLIGMSYAWLPDVLARRSVIADRLARAVSVIRPYARIVDRFLWPRISFLTHGIFLRVMALICLIVAAVTPLIELVPLAGIVPNAAIVAFGLAITAHDGVWALIGILVSAASLWLIYSVI